MANRWLARREPRRLVALYFCKETTTPLYDRALIQIIYGALDVGLFMTVLAYPLIGIVAAIDHRPDMRGRQAFDQFQIGSKCFQSDAAPNIVACIFVAVWTEEFGERIFVQRQHFSIVRHDRQTPPVGAAAIYAGGEPPRCGFCLHKAPTG